MTARSNPSASPGARTWYDTLIEEDLLTTDGPQEQVTYESGNNAWPNDAQ
jgi:hypothetical protein